MPATLATRSAALGIQNRVTALADALTQASQNPAATATGRAQAVGGLEILRAMLDNVQKTFKDPRFAFQRPTWANVLPIIGAGITNAEKYLSAAAPAGFQRYAGQVKTSMQGMGIISWNPNLWGLTQEEAIAYEKAQAQAALDLEKTAAAQKVEEAKGDATANAISPTVTSTLSSSFQSAMQATTSTYNLLLIGGVVALGIWGYSEFKKGKRA